MIRMEIALFLVLTLVASVYFSAGKKPGNQHRAFSALLILTMINLVFDGLTVHTVNRLDELPILLNDVLHHIFLTTIVGCVYLFYVYVALLVEEETGTKRRFVILSRVIFVLLSVGTILIPVRYTRTPVGNYSDGIVTYTCYLGVALYLLMSFGLLIRNWVRIQRKKKLVIITALMIELMVALAQALNHTWLITGMGLTLMCMAVYLTLENPDLLRGELTEQRLSMLYFKSQINPHFLYNTMDTIIWLIEADKQQEAVEMVSNLSSFFRHSLSKGEDVISLAEEERHVRSYLQIQHARYKDIMEYTVDIDPGLHDAMLPKLTLQPLVENALYHGIKLKRAKGTIRITGRLEDGCVLLRVEDNGVGMTRERLSQLRSAMERQERVGFGLSAVNQRLMLQFGPEYGLRIHSEEGLGTTVTARIPYTRKEAVSR